MKKFMGLLVPVLLVYLLNPFVGHAQDETITLAFSPESTITVDGTSNRDDWTVNAPQFEGDVTLNHSDDGALEIIEARLNVKSQEITSGRSSIMDRLMRDALKASEHPDIDFVLTGVDTDPSSAGSSTFNVHTTGELTLGGVTQSIEVAMEAERLDNGSYQFTGSHTLNMTDYDLSPPTAMFGALVTGEEVVVNFDLLAE
jgi:polyisoprenoid-binding protein YceI